jgi:hypothetical protein
MSEKANVDRRTLIAGAGILSAAATLPAAATPAAPAAAAKWDP